jgi:hypothetical protein
MEGLVTLEHIVDVFVTAFLSVAGVIGLVVILAALVGYPVKWMMNYLFTPTVLHATFGISQMTFWKAFWLAILTGFLFGAPHLGIGR